MRWQDLSDEEQRKMVESRKHSLPRCSVRANAEQPRHAPGRSDNPECGAMLEHRASAGKHIMRRVS